jgi:peptidoglycan/LPS O-acetylase OafA/YrhL
VFVFPFDYYITHFGWYQIFAFPTGVFWAYYYKEIKDMIDKQSLLFYIFLPVIGIIAVVSYKMFLWEVFEMNLPSIIYKAVSEGFSLLFSVSFILLLGFIGSKNKVSKLFAFGGVFAYELFLLHGPFLIKYNPILSKENIVFSFYCWLVAIIGLSYIFYKLASFPKKWGEILE